MLNDFIKGWIFVVLQFLFAGLIIFLSLRGSDSVIPLDNWRNYTGIIIIVSGLILLIFVFINFRQIITPHPVPLSNYTLRTTGLYKLIRHPMYSCLLYTLSGVVLLYQSITALIFLVLLLILFIYKIRFEERKLTEKFYEYKEYIEKTKKLIPFIY